MSPASSPASRRTRAVESFKTAAEAIGPIAHGMSVFVVTRGQISMLDAIVHCLHEAGPANIGIWTWTTATRDVECLEGLRLGGGVISGRLMIDSTARDKNPELLRRWQSTFGPQSIRHIRNHAKMATVWNDTYRILIRGSMNLNYNPQFEQLDVTEGGPDFDLVKRIEDEIPVLPDHASGQKIYEASKVGKAFDARQMDAFRRIKPWTK